MSSRPAVAGAATGPAAAEPGEERVLAPLGRRRCAVVAGRDSGGYRVFSVRDHQGPEPRAGQFYMLAAAAGWGDAGGRPYLPRAFSVAAAAPEGDGVRLEFVVDAVGPGTRRLAALGPGQEAWITGPLGVPFSKPAALVPGAVAAILVGGGVGIAPLAILSRQLAHRGVGVTTLLGFRDAEHRGGAELFEGEVRLATEDGHEGHRGYVTELLTVLLEDDGDGRSPVYACGPPAMLEAVRAICAERGLVAELALETPMGCGYGACFGCAVPLAAGGYMRLCVDGPVVRADRIETALVAGSGH